MSQAAPIAGALAGLVGVVGTIPYIPAEPGDDTASLALAGDLPPPGPERQVGRLDVAPVGPRG